MLGSGAGFWDVPSTSLRVNEGVIRSSSVQLSTSGMEYGGARADSRSRVSKGPRPQVHLIRYASGTKPSQLMRCE